VTVTVTVNETGTVIMTDIHDHDETTTATTTASGGKGRRSASGPIDAALTEVRTMSSLTETKDHQVADVVAPTTMTNSPAGTLETQRYVRHHFLRQLPSANHPCAETKKRQVTRAHTTGRGATPCQDAPCSRQRRAEWKRGGRNRGGGITRGRKHPHLVFLRAFTAAVLNNRRVFFSLVRFLSEGTTTSMCSHWLSHPCLLGEEEQDDCFSSTGRPLAPSRHAKKKTKSLYTRTSRTTFFFFSPEQRASSPYASRCW
jgi:hypothetical protein